jgi:hypothetical protein
MYIFSEVCIVTLQPATALELEFFLRAYAVHSGITDDVTKSDLIYSLI